MKLEILDEDCELLINGLTCYNEVLFSQSKEETIDNVMYNRIAGLKKYLRYKAKVLAKQTQTKR